MDNFRHTSEITQNKFMNIAFAVIMLTGLYLSSLYSFLLFHSLAEIFSIVIAYSIFLITWNSRGFTKGTYLPTLGVVYFFIASLDLLHTLSYYGMGIFDKYDANLPTQIWIAARYMESISLALIFFFKIKVRHFYAIFFLYLTILTILFISIFTGIFPDCFISGSGLTPFKKISEYIIAAILMYSVYLVYKNNDLQKNIRNWIILSLLTTIASELMFTFYISVYSISNLLGHYFKIASFYFIYKALIETSLKIPYSGFFNQLNESNDRIAKNEKKLRIALNNKEILLKEVYHRTKNNMAVISSLLNLQSEELKDPALINVFKDAGNRIVSMSLVQEKLYKSHDLQTINLDEYIKELSHQIIESFKVPDKEIDMNIEIDKVSLQPDTVISIGLIINELLSNSLKYAFTDVKKGRITIQFRSCDSGINELLISDDGKGLPEGFNFRESPTLGLQLVEITVTDHLKGTLELNCSKGTEFFIRFKSQE